MTSSDTATSQKNPDASEPARLLCVNGVELHYTDTGDGATVILLHGGMGDLASWPCQIRALSARYRVVAYSRRRSHPNRNSPAPCACFAHCVDQDLDDLLALLTALRVGSVHLVGTSYGALLALAAAMREPDKVASLVLAEPPLHRWACVTDNGKRLYSAFIDDVWRAAAEAFGRGQEHRAMQLLTDGMWGRSMFASWPDERIAAVMRNAAAMKALTLSRDPFPALERSAVACLAQPTLLLQGENTSALHRQVMDELGRVMSDAKRAVIHGTGHGSPHENPNAFNAVVGPFLESLRR